MSRTVAALADRYTKVGYWNVETGKLIGKLDGYSTYRRMIGFSADGTRFGTISTVHVWDTATKQIVAEMQYDNGAGAATLSPNGKLSQSPTLTETSPCGMLILLL